MATAQRGSNVNFYFALGSAGVVLQANFKKCLNNFLDGKKYGARLCLETFVNVVILGELARFGKFGFPDETPPHTNMSS